MRQSYDYPQAKPISILRCLYCSVNSVFTELYSHSLSLNSCQNKILMHTRGEGTPPEDKEYVQPRSQ